MKNSPSLRLVAAPSADDNVVTIPELFTRRGQNAGAGDGFDTVRIEVVREVTQFNVEFSRRSR